MGVMSKSGRPSQRPKPPTLDEIEDDLNEIKDTDIALSIGEKHLENINLASSCFQSQESDSLSNTSTDQTEVSQSQIKKSYDKVLRLMDLYSNLKEATVELDEKMSKLRIVGADMTESISQLKSLSQSIGAGDGHDITMESSGGKKQEKRKENSKSKRKK